MQYVILFALSVCSHFHVTVLICRPKQAVRPSQPSAHRCRLRSHRRQNHMQLCFRLPSYLFTRVGLWISHFYTMRHFVCVVSVFSFLRHCVVLQTQANSLSIPAFCTLMPTSIASAPKSYRAVFLGYKSYPFAIGSIEFSF